MPRIYTSIPVEERFWSKVDKSGGLAACWPWLAAKNHKGYGDFSQNPWSSLAHRVAYILTHGTIPRGMLVCHSCDNPSCCNPAHLWLGTAAANSRDMVNKGRSPKGETSYLRLNPHMAPVKLHPEIVRYGEATNSVRLTEDQVRAIRQRFAQGDVTLTSIARDYGVNRTTISAIVKRKNWRHVA